MEHQNETNEDFGRRMKRLMEEAQKRYERMSLEDQQLLDEAARRHGERVKSEIMASFPLGLEDHEAGPIDKDTSVESLMSWITFIDDRVGEWKTTLPSRIASQLDWSMESLKFLEDYILSSYQYETVYAPENKQAIDAMASYIGEVYRKHIPGAKWYMELEIKSDVDFGRPVVRTGIGVAISPYPLILRVLHERSGNFLRHLYELRIANMREAGMI